ncbi:hypothetical protein QZH41_008587, partial [Actinostola sp. cb2023]
MENCERSKDTEENSNDSTSEFIAQLWYQHGLFCSSHPKLLIFLSAIVVLICSAPLLMSPGFSIPTTVETTTTTTFDSGKETFLPKWFDGKPYIYIIQFVLTTRLAPWMTTIQSHEIMRQALKPAFYATKTITDFRDKDSGQGMSDVCLNVTSGTIIRQRSGLRLQDNQFLPASGCLLLSPANLWNRDLERFSNDKEVFDNMYQNYGRPAFNILLKEYIFGMPLKQTGLYPKMQGSGPDNSVRYAITFVMTSHQQSYIAALKKELQKIYPVTVEPSKSNSTEREEEDKVTHIYYKNDGGSLVELGPISLAYFVVFLYLAFSVAKIDMVKSKWGLAFSAVITVVASLVMAGGLSTFFGLVPNLHSRYYGQQTVTCYLFSYVTTPDESCYCEVFPYLVIMVGVENTLVITKSVVSTPVDLDVKIRVAQGLSKEGKYMMKNLATEMFVIGLGYFTYVPDIQEFCLFALIGLLTDFFLQVFLFSTILSIDIRRMEVCSQYNIIMPRENAISDLDRVSIQQQIMKENSRTTNAASFRNHCTSISTTPRLLPPLPADSIKTPPQCPVLCVRSKRVKLFNFWARTRMVQRACMICAVLYFIYMVFYSVTPSTFHNLTTDQPPDQNMDKEWSLSEIIKNVISEHDTEQYENGRRKEDSSETRRRNRDDSTSSTGTWKGLSKYHWPQLLSYYNSSLLGRYVSILPTVHLGFTIDTQTLTARDEPIGLPKTDPSKQLPDSIQEPDTSDMSINSRDPEYYLNALNCVVLGVIVMIILFFVCKYLNDLQIRPKSTKSFREIGLQYENLVEAMPLSLRGHPQNVEHIKCTVSSIVSICLSGQIRVWDRTTGECIKVINRSGRVSKTGHPKKKPNHEPDKDYTRSKYFESLENIPAYCEKLSTVNISSPGVFSDSDSANTPINTSAEYNRTPSPSGRDEDCKSRTGSVGSCISEVKRGKTIQITCFWVLTKNYIHSTWSIGCSASDGYVELWSLSSGRQICLYCENRCGVTSVAFLPDSPQIVVARVDGTLDFLTLLYPAMSTINNVSPFKRSSPKIARKNAVSTISDANPIPAHTLPVMCSLTHRVRAHHQPASVMVVTKERVVTGSHDRTLKVFRTNDGVRIFTLHGHRDGITALKVLESDPCHVISGASNGGVRVWDVTTGECLQHLRGHTCSVIALACTYNNIISVSIDNSMCIWDRQKGKCIHYKLKQFPDLCSNIVMMSNNLFVTGGQ